MNERSMQNQYHNCEYLKEDGIEIVHCDFYGDSEDAEIKEWWLHLYQEATEDDVNNLEADRIGETISSKAIVISFCPFCGIELIIK